jgi:hypothetical protein
MRPHGDQSTQVLMGSGYNQKKVQTDSLMNESAMGPNQVNQSSTSNPFISVVKSPLGGSKYHEQKKVRIKQHSISSDSNNASLSNPAIEESEGMSIVKR